MGADPVAYAVAAASAAYPRRSLKPSASARRPRTTAPVAGSRATLPRASAVVVVEDVITSGGSALKAIEAVRQEGGASWGVLAVVDREEGGRAALEGRRTSGSSP